MEHIMRGFVDDIEELTEGNTDFRRVLYTARNMQLVLMALQPGEEIGEEVHDDGDQFFRVEDGEGEILIDGNVSRIRADMAMIVPAGARHNVKNTGNEPLKLYTIYSPPEHVDGVVHPTKAEADAAHEHFDSESSESRRFASIDLRRRLPRPAFLLAPPPRASRGQLLTRRSREEPEAQRPSSRTAGIALQNLTFVLGAVVVRVIG